MSNASIILVIISSFIIYSLFSKAISKTIITLPIVFVVLGYLLSDPLKSASDPDLLHHAKRLLAEITLILILFSDASHIRFRQFKQTWQLPSRMLLIGMPLTILVGMIVAYLLNPESGFAMALLTAALLTPTDAALGQTVVSDENVPSHLSQTINVESGLNDGLVLPFVLIGAIFASSAFGHAETDGLFSKLFLQIALAPIVGIVVGWTLARVMDWAQNKDTMNEAAGGVVFLSAAFIAFILSESLGGNGFIAAFIAGMIFGNSYQHDIHFISEFMEGVGQLLAMSAFLMFGAFLLPAGIEHVTPQAIFLAILFLTIVRMVPIYLSLSGTSLLAQEKLFLGWFGPRGIASILFTLIIMDEFVLPNENELLACVSMTVALSIILHGITASPLAKHFAKLKNSV